MGEGSAWFQRATSQTASQSVRQAGSQSPSQQAISQSVGQSSGQISALDMKREKIETTGYEPEANRETTGYERERGCLVAALDEHAHLALSLPLSFALLSTTKLSCTRLALAFVCLLTVAR